MANSTAAKNRRWQDGARTGNSPHLPRALRTDAAHVVLDMSKAKTARQLRWRRRSCLEAKHAAATRTSEMHVAVMLALHACCRKAEYAARIHRLQGQAASDQRIEDAIQRHAIERRTVVHARQRFKIGMTQGLMRHSKGVEHTHTTARHLDASSADQIGRRRGRSSRTHVPM